MRPLPATSSGDPHVVCIGEALYDLLADQKGLARDQVQSWTPYAGGAPFNVATALSKLGAKTAFVSALGKDERGQGLVDILKGAGVDIGNIQRLDAPTRDVYVVRTEDGDREFAGFGLPTDQYADAFIDKSNLPLDKVKNAKLIVTGTLGLAYPKTREMMQAAAEAAKAAGTKIMVDVNWRPVFWLDNDPKKIIIEYLNKADVVKISDADFKYLYDIELITALVNPSVIAEKLPNAAGVLVTAGEEGAAYSFKSAKAEHTGFVPTFKVDVADTTGAGDAFTAGFLYKVLEAGSVEALAADPKKLKEAVVFAAATGALVCQKPGALAGQPTVDEVQELFESSKSWYNFWGEEAQQKK